MGGAPACRATSFILFVTAAVVNDDGGAWGGLDVGAGIDSFAAGVKNRNLPND